MTGTLQSLRAELRKSRLREAALITAMNGAIESLGDYLTDNTEKVFEELPEIDDVRAALHEATEAHSSDADSLTGTTAVLSAALSSLSSLADSYEETIDTHIYDADEEPDNAPERNLVNAARSLVAATREYFGIKLPHGNCREIIGPCRWCGEPAASGILVCDTCAPLDALIQGNLQKAASMVELYQAVERGDAFGAMAEAEAQTRAEIESGGNSQ